MSEMSISLKAQSDETMFLGIASSPTSATSPIGYPLAVGVAYPDTQSSKSILIRPLEKWAVFDPKNQGKEENIAGLRRKNLLTKGVTLEEAASFVIAATKGRSVYCMDVKNIAALLSPLNEFMDNNVNLNSALALFNDVAGNFRKAMSIQLRAKLVIQNYPKNPSDVRWMNACFHGCHFG
jgi:hypothetical protein